MEHIEKRETIIVDDMPPEVIAMLQALYSRDPRTVYTHFERIKEKDAGGFMKTYYVGYGHKSIGDCGTTTLFIEQVSMLCAKGIQHWPLYNGQESSTRYLNFENRQIADPIGTKESLLIQRHWMALYKNVLSFMINYLKNKVYPIQEGDDEEKYNKTINAKAFDIARGFLPAGMTTMVSWHTNLRQASDHLKVLRHHTSNEIKEVAYDITSGLKGKYPNSFIHKTYPAEEEYIEMCRQEIEYSDEDFDLHGSIIDYDDNLKWNKLRKYEKLLNERPAKAELPQELRNCGDIDLRFLIDFGSFRDIQRQRSMVYVMPLLTTRQGFHPWYLEQLPEDFQKEVRKEISNLKKKIDNLDCSDVERQYYIGMGYQVALEITCNLPSLTYIAELRSGQTVHPTLRPIAQEFGKIFKEVLPDAAIHIDDNPDQWSLKRGNQDIVEKTNS